jgi:hypothetical protein
MPCKKSEHPEAEGLTIVPDVANIGEHPVPMNWTVQYFDPRLNRTETSREFSSKEAAMHRGCDLLQQGMRIDEVRGPDDCKIGAAALTTWCKSHRSLERPDRSRRVRPRRD